MIAFPAVHLVWSIILCTIFSAPHSLSVKISSIAQLPYFAQFLFAVYAKLAVTVLVLSDYIPSA